MKTLRVTLEPLEPYFFGGERGDDYGCFLTQHSSMRPYFLKSRKLPSQSTLFGILRYLGIRNPLENYFLGENSQYIGEQSFNLTNYNQGFGQIIGIEQLMLIDKAGNYFYPAPRNHIYDTEGNLNVYNQFEVIHTNSNNRYLPLQYKEKNKGSALFYCPAIHKYLKEDDVFETIIEVGINRFKNYSDEKQRKEKGFFKREKVLLKDGFKFVFLASLTDDAVGENAGFTPEGKRLVLMGKNKSSFIATWHFLEETQPRLHEKSIPKCFIKSVTVGEKTKNCYYAWALSDIYYPGKISELKSKCQLALISYQEHRSFNTRYPHTATEITSVYGRFNKDKIALKLISAGSVFVFDSEFQQKTFKKHIEQSEGFKHAQIAGFNQIYYC